MSVKISELTQLNGVLNPNLEIPVVINGETYKATIAQVRAGLEETSKKGAPNGYAPLNGASKIPDQFLDLTDKLSKGGYTGTAEDLRVLILSYSTGASGVSIVPTSPAPSGTGIASFTATQAGTYTNYGGVVVNANSFAIISRSAAGVFSISQTALDLTDYAKKSETALKPISGNLNAVQSGGTFDYVNIKTLYRKPIINLDPTSFIDVDFTNSLFIISAGVALYQYTTGITVPSGSYPIVTGDRWAIFNRTDNVVIITGNSNFASNLPDKDFYILAQFHPTNKELNWIATSRFKVNGVEISTRLLKAQQLIDTPKIATNTADILTNKLALDGSVTTSTETIGNLNTSNTNSLAINICVTDYSTFANSGALKTARLNLTIGGLVKLVHFRKTGTTWNEIANYSITGIVGGNIYDFSSLNINVNIGDTFGFFSSVATLKYKSSEINSNFFNVSGDGTGSLGTYAFTSASYPATSATSVSLDMQFTITLQTTLIKGVLAKVADLEVENISIKSDIANLTENPQTKFSGRLGATGHIGRTELVFSNAIRKTYRRIFTISQHCDYVRVGFFNAGTLNYNIAKAAVTSLDTTNNFDCTGLTFTNLTFNGNTDGVVPAAAGASRRNYLVSDWVALSSLTPIDNAAKEPKICISAYIDSAQDLILMGNSGGTTDFTNWATHPTRPMVFRYNDGDCVTTPANFVSTTNRSTSPIGFIQYVARGQVVTTLIAGDSIANGEGGGIVYAGQTEAFLANVELSSLNGVAYDMVNIAWSGRSTDSILNQILDFLPLNVVPDIAILPIASPNDQTTITDATVRLQKQRNSRAILELEKYSIKTIVTTWLATNTSTKAYGVTDALRVSYNEEVRALASKGIIVADYAFILDDPANIINGQVQLKAGISDGIHPNDAGKSLLKPLAKNAILALAVAKVGNLIKQ